MARKTIAKTKLTRNDLGAVAFTAPTVAADGFACDASGADYLTLLMFQNTAEAASTVTVKIGNGIQGVGSDITLSMAAGSFASVVVDSGAYKQMSGDDAGSIVVIPSALTVKAAVIVLP